jgi:hypothetical protein
LVRDYFSKIFAAGGMASGEAAQPPANRRYPCIHASAATLHRFHFPAAAFPSKRALSLPRRDAAAAAPAVAQVFGSPVARSGEAPWRLWRWRGPGRQPISVTLLLRLLQSESGSARSPAAHRLVSPATRSRYSSLPPIVPLCMPMPLSRFEMDCVL